MSLADRFPAGRERPRRLVVVGPLCDGSPDLSYIEDAARPLAPLITPGATVVLESTTYPGTTEQLFAPLLERGSGLRAGAAKPTKLMENTFRHVDIALVNELAVFAHDLGFNVREAIDAASTTPFGYLRLTPVPGVGGHCLPVDPPYPSWQVKQQFGHSFRFVELANDVDEHMPDYVVQRAGLALNRQRKTRNLLLGLAYKRNTSDARESPVVHVAQLLAALGADVRAVDSHMDLAVVGLAKPLGARLVELTQPEVDAADLVILLVDHDHDHDHDHDDDDLTLLARRLGSTTCPGDSSTAHQAYPLNGAGAPSRTARTDRARPVMPRPARNSGPNRWSLALCGTRSPISPRHPPTALAC